MSFTLERVLAGDRMATYVEIRKFVQRHHGFVPKTGWIAHVKALRGVPTRHGASGTARRRRVEPCPPSLVYQGITYTTREKVIDLGPLKASVDKEKSIPLPPIVGVAALAGGVVLVIVGARKS